MKNAEPRTPQEIQQDIVSTALLLSNGYPLSRIFDRLRENLNGVDPSVREAACLEVSQQLRSALLEQAISISAIGPSRLSPRSKCLLELLPQLTPSPEDRTDSMPPERRKSLSSLLNSLKQETDPAFLSGLLTALWGVIKEFDLKDGSQSMVALAVEDMILDDLQSAALTVSSTPHTLTAQLRILRALTGETDKANALGLLTWLGRDEFEVLSPYSLSTEDDPEILTRKLETLSYAAQNMDQLSWSLFKVELVEDLCKALLEELDRLKNPPAFSDAVCYKLTLCKKLLEINQNCSCRSGFDREFDFIDLNAAGNYIHGLCLEENVSALENTWDELLDIMEEAPFSLQEQISGAALCALALSLSTPVVKHLEGSGVQFPAALETKFRLLASLQFYSMYGISGFLVDPEAYDWVTAPCRAVIGGDEEE